MPVVEVLLGGQSSSYVQTTFVVFLCCEATGGWECMFWVIFPRQSMWGVTCLGFTQHRSRHMKETINGIQYISCHILFVDAVSHRSTCDPPAPHLCWNPQNSARFSETINLRGHMPMFTLKVNVFPIYLHKNPIIVCWNPQNSACFSKMIDLRGHMPRFTLKMNIFPSISLETPKDVCWNPQNSAHFLRRLIWGVTCLGLL